MCNYSHSIKIVQFQVLWSISSFSIVELPQTFRTSVNGSSIFKRLLQNSINQNPPCFWRSNTQQSIVNKETKVAERTIQHRKTNFYLFQLAISYGKITKAELVEWMTFKTEKAIQTFDGESHNRNGKQ